MIISELVKSIRAVGCENTDWFEGDFVGGYHLQQKPDELARLICVLAAYGPFRSSLDIGIASGGTTRLIREHVQVEKTAIIDDGLHPRFSSWPVNRSAIGRVEEFIGDSHCRDAELFAKKHGPYDFVGIDGDHSEAGVRADWEMVKPCLVDGAVVWFHDIQFESGVAELWEELRLVNQILLETDELGIGVLRAISPNAPYRGLVKPMFEHSKIELGGGRSPRGQGFVNLDFIPTADIPISLDALGRGNIQLPFADNSVQEVYSSHVLNRIDPYQGILHEIARVCCPGARVEIIVPHWAQSMARSRNVIPISEEQVRHWEQFANDWWGDRPKRLRLSQTDYVPTQHFNEARSLFRQLSREQLFRFVQDTCHEIRYTFTVVESN